MSAVMEEEIKRWTAKRKAQPDTELSGITSPTSMAEEFRYAPFLKDAIDGG